MIQPRVKVFWRKKLRTRNISDTDFSQWYDLTDFGNFNVQVNMEIKRDTHRIIIQNISQRKANGTFQYDPIQLLADIDAAEDLSEERAVHPFHNEDEFRVYAWNGAGDVVVSSPDPKNDPVTTGNAVLLLQGSTFDIDYTSQNGNNTYNISVANRTQELLHSKEFGKYELNTLTVPEMIVNLVDRANLKNTSAKKVFAALDTDGGYVQSTSSSAATPFIQPQYFTAWKSLYEHIRTLSDPKKHGDENGGMYHFWVDEENNLHWKVRDTALQSQVVQEEEVASVTVNQNSDDVINSLIIHAGNDPNGNGISVLVFDRKSIAKVGAKWKYKPILRIADEIQIEERTNGPSRAQNSGKTIPDDSNYPDGFPWYLKDEVVNFSGEGQGTNYVANKEEYKDAIRNRARLTAKNQGNEILEVLGNPKWESKAELEYGSYDYVIGKYYQVIVPSRNFDRPLRLKQIAHTFNQSGWNTNLTLKEDPEDAE